MKKYNYFFSNFVPGFVGIYLIYNGFFDFFYIGMTLDFGPRQIQHRNDLENDRHDNLLFQLHFNKMKELGLDTFEWIQAKPILIFPVYYLLNPLKTKKLEQLLINLEEKFIQIFKSLNYNVYNQTVFEKTDPEKLKEQMKTQLEEVWKDSFKNSFIKQPQDQISEPTLIHKNSSINSPKCVEISNVGVFKTIQEAATAISMDPMKLTRWLGNSLYWDYYHFISYSEFLEKSKNDNPNHNTESLVNPNSNSAKYVKIRETGKPDQYFSSIKDAANAINQKHKNVSQWLNKTCNKPIHLANISLEFVTLQEFLIHSPPVHELKDSQSALIARRAKCILVLQEKGFGAYESARKAARAMEITESKLNWNLASQINYQNYWLISLSQYQEILKFGISVFIEMESI